MAAANCVEETCAISITVLPPEIILKIMKYLPKEDLLNCRLVSNAWNVLTLAQLKKAEYTQNLSGYSIAGYIKFLLENKGQTVLPLHISIQHKLEIASVTQENIETLLRLAGHESIAGIRLKFLDNSPEFFQTLLSARCELRYLEIDVDVTEHDFNAKFTPTQATTFLRQNPNLIFPKLMRIRITPDMSRSSQEWEFYSVLLQRCPALQDLTFLGPLSVKDVSIRIPFEKNLESLRLRNLKDPGSLLNDMQSAISLHPSGVINLRKFAHDLYNQEDIEPNNKIAMVLELLSSNLESLSFAFQDEFGPDYSVCLPPMPKLEHLQICLPTKWDHMVRPVCLNASAINLTPDFFPALKSVDVPLGLYWDRSQRQNHDSRPVVFSTVSTVNFKVYGKVRALRNSTGKDVVCTTYYSIKDYFYHVFEVFPNPSRVSIECIGSFIDWDVAHAINEIIRKLNASSILEFEVRNCTKDYLGRALYLLGNSHLLKHSLDDALNDTVTHKTMQLLQDFELDLSKVQIPANYHQSNEHGVPSGENDAVCEPKHHLTNVSLLRLLRNEPGPETYSTSDDISVNQNTSLGYDQVILSSLMLVDKHLPSLRTLEISWRILCSKSYFDAYKIAREIESRFKNWTINVV